MRNGPRRARTVARATQDRKPPAKATCADRLLFKGRICITQLRAAQHRDAVEPAVGGLGEGSERRVEARLAVAPGLEILRQIAIAYRFVAHWLGPCERLVDQIAPERDRDIFRPAAVLAQVEDEVLGPGFFHCCEKLAEERRCLHRVAIIDEGIDAQPRRLVGHPPGDAVVELAAILRARPGQRGPLREPDRLEADGSGRRAADWLPCDLPGIRKAEKCGVILVEIIAHQVAVIGELRGNRLICGAVIRYHWRQLEQQRWHHHAIKVEYFAPHRGRAGLPVVRHHDHPPFNQLEPQRQMRGIVGSECREFIRHFRLGMIAVDRREQASDCAMQHQFGDRHAGRDL